MKWKNALEAKPKDKSLVLVQAGGAYAICIYDKEENIYKLKDRIGTYFVPKREKIYWVEFTPPE